MDVLKINDDDDDDDDASFTATSQTWQRNHDRELPPIIRKTHSPGKPSFPECSCLIVINTDLHSLNLSSNINTLYKLHTYRIYCIYMSHYFCLFVNSLRMSEDNKALLTYLLTYLLCPQKKNPLD